eukprot:GAHX01003152.1.p1 GENE.GAHX01003152.1~~GAHX01003152.1.p1  ORF type:complete len:65 (+),score=4.02 GAHX01003152.1:191-385(+)
MKRVNSMVYSFTYFTLSGISLLSLIEDKQPLIVSKHVNNLDISVNVDWLSASMQLLAKSLKKYI